MLGSAARMDIQHMWLYLLTCWQFVREIVTIVDAKVYLNVMTRDAKQS
jgi:hypothetical protein